MKPVVYSLNCILYQCKNSSIGNRNFNQPAVTNFALSKMGFKVEHVEIFINGNVHVLFCLRRLCMSVFLFISNLTDNLKN